MQTAAPIRDHSLTDAQKEQFLCDGFVKIESAFPKEIASEARELLWQKMGLDPHDRTTWIHPVLRIADCPEEPFRMAANTLSLHAAFDDLVGPGRWLPRQSLGGFPIRFPHPDDPGDTGWHIDSSFSLQDPTIPSESYADWRVNLVSKGRALLMLFLFSDIGEDDAPTRIRVGSHLRIPKILASAGEDGLSGMELGPVADQATADLPEALATGATGTVYLCHPFLVHAAQPHRGTHARFLAQPPLYPTVPFELERADGDYSLVEQAIRLGLKKN